MIRLKRSQLILALLTLGMLVVTSLSTFCADRTPAIFSHISSTANSSTASITTASEDAMKYAFCVKQWTNGAVPKSVVVNAQVILAKSLHTMISSNGESISAFMKPATIQAFKIVGAVIQKSPPGIYPNRLRLTTRAALAPSLVIIRNLAPVLMVTYLKSAAGQLSSAIKSRRNTLTQNMYIVYLFLLMIIILFYWVAVTFSARNKSIESFIESQFNDLESSKEKLKNTRVDLTELKILDTEKNEFTENLARFAVILQGQRDLMTVSKIVLSELAPLVNIQHGEFYIMNDSASGQSRLQALSTSTYKEDANTFKEWKLGQSLVDQCAAEKGTILLTEASDNYAEITSKLGEVEPLNIIVIPMIFEGEVKGVLELASFTPYSPVQQSFLDQLALFVGIVINTIEINTRTDELLKQSQTLTEELQRQQEELRETNQELEEKTQRLEVQNLEVEEIKNAIEEKALQLELTSKYKSQFLTNMSHELRTPLNSLLILSEHLSENLKSHLDPKEVEFAKLIHVSGIDLLLLINEVLDLSKIESGTVWVDSASVLFAEVREQIENTFRHMAKDRGLDFDVVLANGLPPAIITDEMRLLQVMKNLLANAIKFTEQGHISVRMDRAQSGWSSDNESLNCADEVFVFTVQDTGIGISIEQQRIIFEAFQQGDGRTIRKYGGTGLGLSISREIARLLGGELTLVRSSPHVGSTFALYLPQKRAEVDRSYGTTLKSEHDLHDTHPSNVTPASTSGETLNGKRVLIVDDEIRNIIALSAALNQRGLTVFSAENGYIALDRLKDTPDIDLVLMDIMMPGMDGYETMREIRKFTKFKNLPIIALTAKAMVGDREKCLEAGASDYLSKPVNIEQLASLMQVSLLK